MAAKAPLPLIFLGPSLPQTEAERLCPGEFHGPIVRGQLPALAGTLPRAVVIIDGQFEHALAVSPKEVLATLDRGHAVYGASSIGALRAVELGPFGMQGVGRIFDAFRRGELVADDEVAVSFDPDSLRALSEPLAGIRVALNDAMKAQLCAPDEATAILDYAARLPYRDRGYAGVMAGGHIPAERHAHLLKFLMMEARDQKAEDARAVLRLVAGGWSHARPVARDLPLRSSPPAPQATLRDLPPSPKCGEWDSVRTVPVTETELRFTRIRRVAGVTRVADVTGLDLLGVPNFIAVRPSRDRDCNSVYSGKGLRADDARIGAQMEALEMACALDDRVGMVCASYRDLSRAGRRAAHPDSLIPLFDAPADLTAERMDWVTGWDVISGGPVMLPANAVYFRRSEQRLFWKISSNGLACGNTLTEAIAHGLAELIERDAETMFRLATEYYELSGLLSAVAGPRREQPPVGALPAHRDFPLVRLTSLPFPLAGVVERVRQRGVQVALRLITADVAVPTLLCALWEKTGDARRHLMQYGCGTHPDPLIAARRAITEAAQSRVTAIQGAREDLEASAIATSDPPEEWFAVDAGGVDFEEIPVARHADVREDISFMIDRLETAGLRQVFAVDISNPALEFPVVKMVVPGLELAFHAVNPDQVTFGWRARRYFEDGNSDTSERSPRYDVAAV